MPSRLSAVRIGIPVELRNSNNRSANVPVATKAGAQLAEIMLKNTLENANRPDFFDVDGQPESVLLMRRAQCHKVELFLAKGPDGNNDAPKDSMTELLTTHPELAAHQAGLQYVDPSTPGVSRVRAGRGFSYRDSNGTRITKERVRQRIRDLVIPPAWTKVWICPSPNGHIQATGLDARGRKQYIYHPKWRVVRDQTKYHQLIEFAEALPGIRSTIDTLLRKKGLPRDKVIAAVVSLLEKTLIRVGNANYAKDNGSYGLTTLRNRHVDVHGETISFRFRGKSGVDQSVDLKDRRLAGIIKRSQELPGQELVQYVEEDGSTSSVSSDDINQFLKDVTGREFTAKDFRTWGGTVLAAVELAAMSSEATAKGLNKNIATAIDAVAKQLGNTRAICRACYVHPEILEAFLEGQTVAPKWSAASTEMDLPFGDTELSQIEKAVLQLLKKRRHASD